MLRRHRLLREHPVVRVLFFERFLVTAAGALALAALATGRVRASEISRLLDTRLLILFFVLTIAVELGKASGLFDRLVGAFAARVRTARGLALAMIAVTGVLAMFLTNDVALFLVVPFTLLFRRISEIDLAPIVVLEILSANLLGALSPIGNPQNLFLYTRGAFTPGGFVATQSPLVAASAGLLAAATFILVARSRISSPEAEDFEVDPLLSLAFAGLLIAEVATLFGVLPPLVPLLLSIVGPALLGRRILRADFSLVFVFAFLFVGVAGLERGNLYRFLDPEKIFGHGPSGLLISGALLSQAVSNVPAALLLAPAVGSAHGFQGLLYGVTAGSCGTPVASIANLIGAQLFLQSGERTGPFWRLFSAVSGVLLLALLLVSLILLTVERAA
jgi:Na+/H+ antiporter NhaD/arsenite permease-like protein